MKKLNSKYILFSAGIILTLLGLGNGIRQALADGSTAEQETFSPIHPAFAMLDEDGVNVLDSGKPVSTMKTCGQCHDTDFIASHSFHSDLGFSEVQLNNPSAVGEWDQSSGSFGHWDPLIYRYLSQSNDEMMDLGTPEWIMTYGLRHVGGGPATTAVNNSSLTSLPMLSTNPETTILNSENGRSKTWNWQTSGVVEMNCFLCHSVSPDNDARIVSVKIRKIFMGEHGNACQD